MPKRKSLPATIPVPDLTETPYSNLDASGQVKPASPLSPVSSVLRSHPRWPEIHTDCATSPLSPREICEKYNLRTHSGMLAIFKVAQYRKYILEKYKDIFAQANVVEQAAIRHEVLGKIRHVFDSAADAHELAKSQKTLIGRGQNTRLIDAPNFGAMKEQQDSMLNAGTKLAELAGVGSNTQPHQAPMYQDNRKVTILALPKADGVASRAPLRVLPAKSESA